MQLKPLSQKLREALSRVAPASADALAVAGTMRLVRAAASDTVELLIYGNIGASWWDDESVTAKSVVDALKGTTATTIDVRINSYGGSVSDGVAIHNELRRHAANGVAINVLIDGAACSIASLIAMAGDTITMPSNTLMMLHAPWGTLWVDGNAKEIRELADEYAGVLETFGKAMAQSYARKTGKPAADFEAMWDAGKDYWYDADSAKAFGLCDVVTDGSMASDDDTQDDAAAQASALEHLVARAPETLRTNLRAALRTTSHLQASARTSPPASAGTTTGAITMPDPKKTAAEPNTPAANDPQAALAALRERNTEIRALAALSPDNADVQAYVNRVIDEADPEISAGDVGKEILRIQAKGREPLNGGGRVEAGPDEREKLRTAMARAIDIRTGATRAEGDNPFRGFTMFELARACAERAGVNTRGLDRMDIVGQAFTHSTSDFPLLLSNVAEKQLRRGYEEAAEVFPTITRAVTLTDFKPTSLAGLGRFSNLDKIPENGEYKYGTFSEAGSSLQLATYGKMFSISRQAVINDDLNALAEVPRKMGQAAKRTVGDAVFNILTTNPQLSDGVVLFHASRNNLVSPGSAISTATVDGMRVLMATQKDKDGRVVRVPLKYIVVPVGLGGLARTVLESQFEVSGSKNLTTPNIVRNTFEVVEDPRLDAASPTAWYGVADPNLFDGLVVGYLDGNQTPYLESKEGWSVDGTAWKVRIDAAAAVADPIGLAKNPGA